jgi:hypothetical protein
MNTQPPTPAPAPGEPAAHEPPRITILGTVAELTLGHNPGPISDLTFPGSGVH